MHSVDFSAPRKRKKSLLRHDELTKPGPSTIPKKTLFEVLGWSEPDSISSPEGRPRPNGQGTLTGKQHSFPRVVLWQTNLFFRAFLRPYSSWALNLPNIIGITFGNLGFPFARVGLGESLEVTGVGLLPPRIDWKPREKLAVTPTIPFGIL